MGTHIPLPHASPPHIAAAWASIRQFVRVLRMGDASVVKSTGLSSAQLFVLQLLAHSDAKSVNDLATRTMTDQSSVSVVISRLEAKGLITRLPSPTDARRTTVSITTKGRRVLDKAPPTPQERLVFALQRLTPESLQILSEELSNIVALMGAAHEPSTFLFEDDSTGTR